jgi:hypothetical protein
MTYSVDRPIEVSALEGASASRVSARAVAVSMLGVLLVIDSLNAFAIGLLGAASPRQLDYGEPIVYGQASRILNAEALYQSVGGPPYTVTAYTPLYYVLVAGLRVEFGPGFVWGRAASLLACLATVLVVAYLAARIAKDARVGALAAGIFLAFGFPGWVPWFALYRVDMLGVALSVGTIGMLAGGTSKARLVGAGILAGLALLTKQTFFAATLAGLVWLWPMGWRRACLFGGTVVFLVASSTVVLEVTTGAFITNTILANINSFDHDIFISLASQLLVTQSIPMLCAVFFLSPGYPWQALSTRLLMLYWFASMLSMIGIAKVGANHNYWIEFAATTSVLAANGIWLTTTRSSRLLRNSVSMGLLCLMLLEATGVAWAHLTGGRLPESYNHMLDTRRPENEFDTLVARVRAEPKAVLADPNDVVVLADRPILLEPLIYSIFLSQGQWNAQPLVERICRGDVGLLVLAQPIETTAQAGIGGYPFWPPPVLAALEQTMVLEGTQGGRLVYVPRPGAETSEICRTTG